MSNYIEKLWEKYSIMRMYPEETGEYYSIMHKDKFDKAIQEAMQAQREACFRDYQDWMSHNSFEYDAIKKAILNAEVQDDL